MATPADQNTHETRLHRSRDERVVFGVCGGLGPYVNIDPVIVRLAFVLFTLAGGAGLVVYLLLAIVLPEQDGQAVNGQSALRANIENLGQNARDFTQGFGNGSSQQRTQNLAGLLLIGLGLLALFGVLGWLRWINWNLLWPMLLIAFGFYVLMGRNRAP